ncbi:MAG: hypothetical protein AB7F99_17365 [Vicinamibacterales bacterium]
MTTHFADLPRAFTALFSSGLFWMMVLFTLRDVPLREEGVCQLTLSVNRLQPAAVPVVVSMAAGSSRPTTLEGYLCHES